MMRDSDAERVRDEMSGIGPGSSGCRDGVGTGRGTSHNNRALSNSSPNSTAPTCKLLALSQHCALGRCTFEGGVMSWFVPLKPHLHLRQLDPSPTLSD